MPASVSMRSVSASCQVMCSRPGTLMMFPAPYDLHWLPARSSAAGSQALIRGSCSGRGRNAAVLALGGRHHPVAPVLGHVRHPVAGEVDRRCVPRRPRGGAASLLRARGCRSGERQRASATHSGGLTTLSRFLLGETPVDRLDETIRRPGAALGCRTVPCIPSPAGLPCTSASDRPAFIRSRTRSRMIVTMSRYSTTSYCSQRRPCPGTTIVPASRVTTGTEGTARSTRRLSAAISPWMLPPRSTSMTETAACRARRRRRRHRIV